MIRIILLVTLAIALYLTGNHALMFGLEEIQNGCR